MVEPRLCEVCSSEIPKWKSAGTTVCSVKCKFERRERRNKDAREKRKPEGRVNVKRAEGSILHGCLSNEFDPPKKCKCRKRINDTEAHRLVASGDAVHFVTRVGTFVEGEPLLIVGKRLRTPRSETLERCHMERVTQRKKAGRDRSIEELQAAVKQDQAERFDEEKLRLEIYGALRMEFLNKLIVQIPADEFDRQERETRGRPGIILFDEDRSSVGVDVNGLDAVPDENEIEDESQEFNDKETEPENDEDLRTAEQVIAEHREAA